MFQYCGDCAFAFLGENDPVAQCSVSAAAVAIPSESTIFITLNAEDSSMLARCRSSSTRSLFSPKGLSLLGLHEILYTVSHLADSFYFRVFPFHSSPFVSIKKAPIEGALCFDLLVLMP